MKLSTTITLAIPLLALARPLEITKRSDHGLIRRMPPSRPPANISSVGPGQIQPSQPQGSSGYRQPAQDALRKVAFAERDYEVVLKAFEKVKKRMDAWKQRHPNEKNDLLEEEYRAKEAARKHAYARLVHTGSTLQELIPSGGTSKGSELSRAGSSQQLPPVSKQSSPRPRLSKGSVSRVSSAQSALDAVAAARRENARDRGMAMSDQAGDDQGPYGEEPPPPYSPVLAQPPFPVLPAKSEEQLINQSNNGVLQDPLSAQQVKPRQRRLSADAGASSPLPHDERRRRNSDSGPRAHQQHGKIV